MQVPKFLYGSYKDVTQRCRTLVPRLANGAVLADLIDGWLDTRETPGLLQTHEHVPELGDELQFHCPALMVAVGGGIRKQLSHDIYNKAFFESLEAPWSFVGIAFDRMYVTRDEGRYKALLQAALRHWQELNAEGRRYALGAAMTGSLWEFPSNIHFVLARSGVPSARLRQPLPPGGLAELVEEFNLELLR